MGVDIFFVISGFLISKILFTGMTEHRFSFATFYGRRIFPALTVCLAAVLAYGFVSLTPPELAQLSRARRARWWHGRRNSVNRPTRF